MRKVLKHAKILEYLFDRDIGYRAGGEETLGTK